MWGLNLLGLVLEEEETTELSLSFPVARRGKATWAPSEKMYLQGRKSSHQKPTPMEP